MKILFAVVVLALSTWAHGDAFQKELLEYAAREKESESAKPQCTNVIFTGVSTSATNGCYILSKAISSHDVGNTLAKYPLECRGRDYVGRPNCSGFAFLREQKGKIVDFDSKCYTIETPLEFESGKKLMVGLSIRRQDATCIK